MNLSLVQPSPALRSEPLLARMYGLRRFAGKMRRRVRQLIGRRDPSPWVLAPKRRSASTTYVDFVFALDYASPNSSVVRIFHEAMSAYGLSVLLVNKSNVERMRGEVESGWIRPFVYLDLSSRPGCPFDQLLQAAADAGIYTVAKPIDACWTMKSQAHVALEAAGLPVPPTIILPAGEPDRELTEAERARVGERCVIKPSFGEASRGCVVNVEPTKEAIAKARDYNRADDWLIQKMITWTRYGDRPGYLRGYNVLGQRSLLWWAKQGAKDCYALLSWEDLEKYDLMPALSLLNTLAEMTKMDFFSTEIAITAEAGPARFCLIDYCNDQCDMDPGGPHSPPEEWSRWVAARFAEFTWRRKHKLPMPQGTPLQLF